MRDAEMHRELRLGSAPSCLEMVTEPLNRLLAYVVHIAIICEKRTKRKGEFRNNALDQMVRLSH